MRKAGNFLVTLAAIVALLYCPLNVLAQTSTGQISGQITDPSGAVIPGATITVTNIESGVSRTVTSNESGYYTVPLLQPGDYEITVESQGFRTATVPKVTLEVNQAIQQNFTLEVGTVVETIEVAAEAELLRASTAELGTVIDERAVLDLPLNGRNFTQLLTLNPGASPANVTQNRGGGNATSVGEQTYPAINGQGNRSNIFLTDGALNVGTSRSTYAVPPIVDAIQEFKVQTHNDLAEFGGANGGIVSVVTKGGTNEIHGTSWWFHRNDNLDARNFFLPEVTPLVQNMYGATAGGPIVKNKTFYFVAYQGYKNRRPSTGRYRVPTEAELSGDMSNWHQQIYDPYSTRLDPSKKTGMARDPFPNNMIPVSRFDEGYLKFIRDTVPKPNYVDPFSDRNRIRSNPLKEDQHEYQARVDHTFGPKNSLWSRFGGQFYDYDGSGGRDTMTSYNDFMTYTGAINWLHTFNPTSMFNVQFSVARVFKDSGSQFLDLPDDYPQTIGFNPDFTIFNYSKRNLMPNLNVNGFFSGGESWSHPKSTDTWSWTGSYSKITGNHQLKFGGEFHYADFNVLNNGGLQSVFKDVQTADPNNQAKTGGALASFLLDVPDQAQKKDFNKLPRFGGVFGFYGQDSWKATPKLTINFGLRYNATIVPGLGNYENRFIYHGTWNFANGTYKLQAVPGTCAELGSAPCIPSEDGSLPEHVVVSPNEKLMKNNTDNWQPRFGFAYRVTTKTVIRGSFGIFFDNFAGIQQTTQNNGHTWPDVGRQRATGLNKPKKNKLLPTISGKDPFPGLVLPEPTPYNRQAWFTDPDFNNAYSMQWNFGIQQQLTSTTDLNVNYVGSGNRRQPLGLYYNVALTPGPGDRTARQPFPYVKPNWWQTSWGRSNYNALQAQLRKRFSHGLTLLTNYTWSKAIDIGRSGWFNEDSGVTGSTVQDPYHFNNERGVAGFDLTHIFNVSWTYELPWGIGRRSFGNKFLDGLLGDWQFNGIMRLTSGQPYTVNMNGDHVNTGMINGQLRPDVLRDPTKENPDVAEWFDTSAFAVPPPFTFGNIGRGVLRRDGMNNFDLSLFKKIPLHFIREGMRMELRFEAFNAFNSPQFNKPDSNFSSKNFGKVTSTAISPRQIQVGAKIYF